MPTITYPTASMRPNTRPTWEDFRHMARTVIGWTLIAGGVLGFSLWVTARGEDRVDAKIAAASHIAKLDDKAIKRAVQRTAEQTATDVASNGIGTLSDRMANRIKVLEAQLAEAHRHADQCDARSRILEVQGKALAKQVEVYRRRSYKVETENSLAIQRIAEELKGRKP